MDPNTWRRATLLGLAVGDALGAPLEFSPLQRVRYAEPVPNSLTEMTAGGPFNLAAGQVTDDTHMACALAATLEEGYTPQAAITRYLAWRRVTFDVGGTTSASLSNHEHGQRGDLREGRRAWIQTGSESNGGLMRTAPIGASRLPLSEVIRLSLLDCGLTHFAPTCRLACATYNAMIHHLITSNDRKVKTVQEKFAHALEQAVRMLLDENLTPRGGLLESVQRVGLAFEQAHFPDLRDDALQPSTALYAFRMAFWQMFHSNSFEEGLVRTVNHGGDADTVGAITGALLGAYFGEIPERWEEAVLSAPGLGGGIEYHPARLLRFCYTAETRPGTE